MTDNRINDSDGSHDKGTQVGWMPLPPSVAVDPESVYHFPAARPQSSTGSARRTINSSSAQPGLPPEAAKDSSPRIPSYLSRAAAASAPLPPVRPFARNPSDSKRSAVELIELNRLKFADITVSTSSSESKNKPRDSPPDLNDLLFQPGRMPTRDPQEILSSRNRSKQKPNPKPSLSQPSTMQVSSPSKTESAATEPSVSQNFLFGGVQYQSDPTRGFTAINKQLTPANHLQTEFSPDIGTGHGFLNEDALQDVGLLGSDYDNNVSSERITQDLKALLEAGYEDENEKPKLRVRRSARQKKILEAKQIKKGTSKKSDNPESASKSSTDDSHPEKITKDNEEDEDDGDEVKDGSVEGLKVKLLPHQVDGVAWMQDRENGRPKKSGLIPKGGILADDMGLGKTVQTLALLRVNPRPDPAEIKQKRKKGRSKIDWITDEYSSTTLIVAPLALIRQWEAEIADKTDGGAEFPPLTVYVYHACNRNIATEKLTDYDVVVTTYQLITSQHTAFMENMPAPLFDTYWYRIVLDEAHSIKNKSAKCSVASYSLKAWYRWCLTGTPIQNKLDELQSLIQFLRIPPFNDEIRWKQQIMAPMKNGRAGLAFKRLHAVLQTILKRRLKEILKKEGALTFPGAKSGKSPEFKIQPRIVKVIMANFDPSERRYYDELVASSRKKLNRIMSNSKTSYIDALVLLLRLRQACDHPEIVKSALAEDLDTDGEAAPKSEIGGVLEHLEGLDIARQACKGCCYVSEVDKMIQIEQKPYCKDCANEFYELEKVKRERLTMGTPKKSAQKSKKGRSSTSFIYTETNDGSGRVGSWLPNDEESTDDDGEHDPNSSVLTLDDDSDLKMAPSTKIRYLIRILRQQTPEHKVIVFSNFTAMLDLLEPFLFRFGFKFVRYDGKVQNAVREKCLETLRNDPDVRVLLCSLKCGGLGLNLTVASRVVLMEPFWNPSIEEQAIDRVHRLNQTKPVEVYRLAIEGTVEVQIMKLQEAKRKLVENTLSNKKLTKNQGADKAAKQLSLKELVSLFSNSADEGDQHYDGLDNPEPKFSLFG